MNDPSAFSPLEAVTRVTPLGVRFWDPLEQAFVADGLSVNVRFATSARRYAATMTSAGVFSAQNLPLLREAERGAGDDAYWAGVATRSFVVEVDDPLGRFLSFSFPALLPARGLFVWSCALASPLVADGPSDGVVLFSAPSRPATPMRAAIRTELRDATTGKPAAGAVLVATVAGGALRVTGIADAQGRVVLLFPFPEPQDFPPIGDVATSPPASPTGSSLAGHTWPVTLSAQYAPSSAPYPDYPDLCTTLGQPPSPLWGDTNGAALPAQTLKVGSELVVRTSDASTGTPLSVLLVKG